MPKGWLGDNIGYPSPKWVCVWVCTCRSGGGDRERAPVGVALELGEGVLRSDVHDFVVVEVVGTVDVSIDVGVAPLLRED